MQRLHGGPDAQGVPRYDFSTNSNACGPCPWALAAVQQADASCYPDPGYRTLREQLAAFHGVLPQRVLLAGSASEFIFRITAWVAQQGERSGQGECAVWLPRHGYGDYALAAQAWALPVTTQPRDAQLLWCCDPSSPLGTCQDGLQGLAATPGVCVMDRAYEPLRLSGALALSDAQVDRVWQLWTPNKALGLTGVRAAYVIAPIKADDAVAALERLCVSWPVGAHGVALLQAWTLPEVQAWLADSQQTLQCWKTRQVGLCESLGWTCLPSDTNFFCVRPHAAGLGHLLDQLRGHGIKLRDTASFGLLGHVRLSVQPPLAQDALADAWQKVNERETP
ncbi:aminotransferase class I/II-fold pyridoxal phosphate-dependent enzyme [Rhodoferax sediminis]|uniref:histidinol-phosphate transaminase n=1 Tax=Rhodoferax sediminis TaxID=2509614 RepID=A0A515DGQ1_9BURK|nr:aminotransferase class I/II-fold pyridoxal phosphate-dependent enzyme [Rhodoferax sediminis]QDL39603.1 aminotransferase class I/II-fold pyridoxal phosphate-dependent enzyme [Rhodoferax sediminis]